MNARRTCPACDVRETDGERIEFFMAESGERICSRCFTALLNALHLAQTVLNPAVARAIESLAAEPEAVIE